MNTRRARPQAGFTIVEALVALVIVGSGLLALGGMQLALSRNADVSKQRTEAMRLAQDKMESLRSFTHLGSATGGWAALAGGSDTISGYDVGNDVTVNTNASFARTWSLGGVEADSQRSVSVSVAWTDRAGAVQNVTLSSVIARVDPKAAGFLAFPLPNNTNLKRPKNRNLNIPIQARDLGDGKSAYQLPAGFAIVFSDVTGYVVEKCATDDITAANYRSGSAGCSTYNAYLLAGYISGAVSNSSGGAATMPTGINTHNLTGWDNSGGKTISCSVAQARDQNTAALIPNYQYYICVIPVAPNGAWSGRVKLGGVSTSGNLKVCRFQYAATDFVNDNERNVQDYSGVNESLDNQNYHIENSANASCPTLGASISGVTGGSVTTVLHQDCRVSTLPTVTIGGTCPVTAFNAALQ
ncbi:MAG: type IV pilus modification PilV family protein [Roseateles sp.]|uniref:type IV pilus modification PilV family protein n=1 Tax=Roseateles sp. TaxID=1971397 RepID=UPI0040363306